MAWLHCPKGKSCRNDRICIVQFDHRRNDAGVALSEFGLHSAGDDISHLTRDEGRAIRHAINVRVLQERYYILHKRVIPPLDKSKPYIRRVFDICAARPELTRAHYPWLNR